jgi:hypothetical protein
LFSSGKALGESTTATSQVAPAAFTTSKTLLKPGKFRFHDPALAGAGRQSRNRSRGYHTSKGVSNANNLKNGQQIEAFSLAVMIQTMAS